MLSQIESQLGNVEEAKRIADQAVQNAPENTDAHMARGYSFIYSNHPQEAFEAFREALRLEPNNEFARSGLLRALQMHHFFYRGMFRFFALMNRLSASVQWGLLIGFFIGYRILMTLMRQHPGWTPIILPVVILYVLFAFMSWISEPVTFFLLLFNRWGRLAMNGRQKLAGLVFATFLPLGTLGLLYVIKHREPVWLFLLSFGLLLTMIPITCVLRTDDKRTRRIYSLYTLAMIGVLIVSFFDPVFISLAILMFIGFQFLANYYSIRSTTPQ
jgi:tetratricopeptide (TPR) repeat protein